MKVIFFLVAFFGIRALCCEDVRLDRDPNILGHVPAWDQGDNGTCWAFTATQLIDGYRFSHGDTDYQHLTSPLMVAAAGVANNAGNYSWGNQIKAIDMVREKGSCNAKWVSDHLGIKKSSDLISNLETIYDLTEPAIIHKEGNNNGKTTDFVDFADAETSRKAKKAAAEKTSLYLSEIGIEDKIAPGTGAILKALEKNRVSYVHEILNFICKETKPLTNLPHPDYTARNPDSNNKLAEKEFRQMIDQNLRAKKLTAPTFCYTAVMHKDVHLITKDEVKCNDESTHIAVVVGSRRNSSQQCEYLVRDSFCSAYEKRTKRKIFSKGQHWMNADRLLKNTMARTYFP